MPRACSFRTLLAVLGLQAVGLCLGFVSAGAEPLTRAEALQIDQSYAEHRWHASAQNVRHGLDSAKVAVNTPNREATDSPEAAGHWTPDAENIGVPYKWGGFDTLAGFDAGVRAGKAAGDLYDYEKRRKGGDAVSAEAVGVDCSGFISRCWKLREKLGTSTLETVSVKLASPADLKPGDIMNASEGHVILFARWLDAEKTQAYFYESEPFSKVIASVYPIADLTARGFRPLRYRAIRD